MIIDYTTKINYSILNKKGKVLQSEKKKNKTKQNKTKQKKNPSLEMELLNYYIIEQLCVKFHSISSRILLFLQSFPLITRYCCSVYVTAYYSVCLLVIVNEGVCAKKYNTF